MNPESGPAVQNDSVFSQNGEVTRDFGLLHEECVSQIADAKLIVGFKK